MTRVECSRLGRLTSFTRIPCRRGIKLYKVQTSQNLAFICLSSAHPHAIVLVSSAPGGSPFLIAYTIQSHRSIAHSGSYHWWRSCWFICGSCSSKRRRKCNSFRGIKVPKVILNWSSEYTPLIRLFQVPCRRKSHPFGSALPTIYWGGRKNDELWLYSQSDSFCSELAERLSIFISPARIGYKVQPIQTRRLWVEWKGRRQCSDRFMQTPILLLLVIITMPGMW